MLSANSGAEGAEHRATAQMQANATSSAANPRPRPSAIKRRLVSPVGA
jgi:hypothetical protein